MKRITIGLSEDVAAALEREAKRNGVSMSDVVREALCARLGLTTEGKRHIPFAGIGRSGYTNTAPDFDEILAKYWTYEVLMYGEDAKHPG
jgi:hypothetical protein